MSAAPASCMTTFTDGGALGASPLAELDANRGTPYTTSPAILPGTRTVVDNELDVEARLNAEITTFAEGILILITSTVFHEIAEPDNRSAPERKPIIHIANTDADTDAEEDVYTSVLLI